MKTDTDASGFRPDKLDVRRFAREQAHLRGQRSLADFERLREEVLVEDEAALAAIVVDWEATGVWRELRGGAAETRLQLRASVALPLPCQLCLDAVTERIVIDRQFLFVTDEATAEKLDEESLDDVLVASKSFDLFELIEDEILMDMPIVPQHEACPHPLPMDDEHLEGAAEDSTLDSAAGETEGDTSGSEQKPNPFAILKKLH